MKSHVILFFLLSFVTGFSQSNILPPTPAEIRLKNKEIRENLLSHSLVGHLPFENIGPTVMSGRIADIDVNPDDPTHFLVAYASGGIWKTENNGTSFTSIFDHEPVMTIGDIAVNWDLGIIWAGTGEVNSSRSSYAGDGIYKSLDWGKTWEYLGLPESHHIGRIMPHPGNHNVLWVAALGHLYSPNPERGIYKTTDGGNTWQKVLFVDENAGAVDLIMEPGNPNTLYAAIWERSRRAWNFVESGDASGIYKTTNGGETWQKVSLEENGFPEGEGVGRIGLTLSKKDNQTTIYALLDNQERRPEEEEKDKDLLTKDDLREMTREQFLQLDEGKLEQYLRDNRFPQKYTAKSVIEMARKDEIVPNDLVIYLEDANRMLFDTPVIGAELYVSKDHGTTWAKTHESFLDGVYNSYGYYFGLVKSEPGNPDQVYIAGVPILRSDDGGKTFKSVDEDNVHVDHHALWINPHRKRHIINGNDGGINISYDAGENWIKCNSPSVGQFYYINVDMAEPYHIYGGLQDNGVWYGPSNYRHGTGWHSTGEYPYKSLLGGDGMQVQIDTRDNTTVYTGLQFGNYYRINRITGKRERITPSHELGESPYRWNWQSPILISTHNKDIIYFGAHMLFRSFNQGNDFIPISGDLTTGGKQGDVPYGTLTTIHESPLKFGLIYTGSDDGLIHVSRDGGNQWNLISGGLPQNLWIARVIASHHDEATVYVALNGYRWDDFNSYVYKSADHGENWERIGLDLPVEPVNVIKEDPENEDILYVGTDHSTYVSIDGGSSFMLFHKGLTNAPVHDVVIHPREGDLLVGTHGRSIYKGDIKPLRKLHEIKDEEIYVFELSDVRYNPNAGRQFAPYREPVEPEIDITIYTPDTSKAILEIQTKDSLLLFSKDISLKKGISVKTYDLTIDAEKKEEYLEFLKSNEKDEKKKEEIEVKEADNGKIYLQPGEYRLRIIKGEAVSEQLLKLTERGRGRG